MVSLGKRIKELREQKNLTQRELAEIMRYKTTRSVQLIEADEQSLDNRQLIALAKYFGVSTDYLLGISDNPNPDSTTSNYFNGTFMETNAFEYKTDKNINSKPTGQLGQINIDKLIKGLDEESMNELRKYITFLHVRQKLDDGEDESSAGLDSGKEKEGIK